MKIIIAISVQGIDEYGQKFGNRIQNYIENILNKYDVIDVNLSFTASESGRQTANIVVKHNGIKA